MQSEDNPILSLPDAPSTETGSVKAWQQPVEMRTYLPEPADLNPMFLEKRVYQGSSGRVYPLPFIDRIATEPKKHSWQAVHLENAYLRLMILPEIGGRIHIGYDKGSGYDFFYRQNVIKPALVGLAGPWISGGVEFNWPQHHRPATFMPVSVEVERHDDGSVTVWLSDHDPMNRMKGMHGVCLHPDRASIEVKVRLYNRTPYRQTFLWWANVATRVHEHYQSFFPGDVRYVADHAKRAVTSFPLSDRPYYGVDYPGRARSGVPLEEQPAMFVPDGSYAANDLSWYANIPVPTSYMITATRDDFFGGYDHAARAGVVHVANHHVAPGKKQWTWGNHDFGYAWDRSLTESDGPYIELMAGVYTDNQPDFSYLAPGETKSFSQFWYPIREIGVPQAANVDAALSMRVDGDRIRIGVAPARDIAAAKLSLLDGASVVAEWRSDLEAGKPFLVEHSSTAGAEYSVLLEAGGASLLRYEPRAVKAAEAPTVATEPLPPAQIATVEELFLTGLHLEQYRHATRSPEPYWREALARDAEDSRTNNALGLWHLRRGEFVSAEEHFRRAIARLTRLNPNPLDGEPYYNLGLTLRFLGREEDAYAAFYKATWNAAWRGPAYHALAEKDAAGREWQKAADHLQRCLRADADNLRARNLLVLVSRRLGNDAFAAGVLAETRQLDPLDDWAIYLESGRGPLDNQRRLDLAFDLMRAGFDREATDLLEAANLAQSDGSSAMVLYSLGFVRTRMGDMEAGAAGYARAAAASSEYVFPSRLEELVVLKAALAANPADGHAHYYLGNLLYDRRRHEEAIAAWEKATQLLPLFPTAWRNLGVAYFNVRGDAAAARNAYEQAFAVHPTDARVLYERDQLRKRLGEDVEQRLKELERYPGLLRQRDDLTVELATLLNQTGRPERALTILLERRFQPWEGGEGLVLGQYVRSRLLLGHRALLRGEAATAREHFAAALAPPANLGEARHLLANPSDIYYWLGVACAALGDLQAAEAAWTRAATHRGDFQQMSVRSVSEMSFWGALANRRLGNEAGARAIFEEILAYSAELAGEEPKIDYFATSLPSMLLFEDDLLRRNQIAARLLRAQGLLGLGDGNAANSELGALLTEDKGHAATADLTRWLAEDPELDGAGLTSAAQKPHPGEGQ